MYLLKLPADRKGIEHPLFTFHYVSIKTISYTLDNMFISVFTFHYVSIKTKISDTMKWIQYNLHSTMYLLKLVCKFSDWNFHGQIYIPLCIY